MPRLTGPLCQKILQGNIPPIVAVSLSNIVSKKELSMPTGDIRSKFGIHPKFKVLLFLVDHYIFSLQDLPNRKE